MEQKELTSRAIIIIENKLITIKRTKYYDTKEYIYYTFPGGHVEENETYENTVIREVEEELGIKIKINEEFESMYNEDINRFEKFYICSYLSGKVGTGTGPEFQNVDLKKYGKYEIEYIPLDKILEYNLLPEKIKINVCEKFNKKVLDK